jgi:hypothetical protein
MFSFYDTNYMDDESTEGSRLLLGGYDMKYAAKGAEMRWAPLIDDSYWMVPLTGFSTKAAGTGDHKKNEIKQVPITLPAADFVDLESKYDHFRVGKDVEKTNLHTMSDKVIVDSGSSYIVMPTRDFDTFTKYLAEDFGIELYKEATLKGFTCTMEQFERMPDLVFGLHGQDVTIPRDSYVYREKGNKCVLLIQTMNLGGGYWYNSCGYDAKTQEYVDC